MIWEYDAKRLEGLEPSLARAVEVSLVAQAVEDEHGLICLYGYAGDLVGSDARVWFYPMRSLDGYRVAFLRRCRRFISVLESRYNVLYGTCAVGNAGIERWLRWLGFEPNGETIAIGGRELWVFEKRRA